MCKPNGEAGIPAECPRRGDCRGCPMLPSAMAGEGIAARFERPPPASVFPETRLRFGNPMPTPKKQNLSSDA